ncbi:5-formyltetrahydrofolate cyclo-ligase [Salegentibacter sp. 24]|jgi:5-formyltetrahydrofolate cyclo-ligase|uniref:5-formyltetrahydrofolate cyclo-ligase n=1 Tax=Salegentibacter sp. 24 TaxID=2183986 RepID=UPI001061F332|nr:5-formyltetrahydrofolate cyclo-ligase [Salegentibacter sp. 24]TDN95142.1 5-formyltetrahydrofolate cyclo-ligase [Salegentibacter sp. 24]
MNKAELRKKYKALRLEISQEKIEELSLEIANQLLLLPIWEEEFYHLFLSIAKQKEVDTSNILHILQGKDKNVVLSKTNIKKHKLEHFLLTDNSKIRINRWNIPEPEGGIQISPQQIDVVFVPLLAFDVQGHRIGYGKGFYDNFLSECNSKVIKIGLSFFDAEPAFKEVFSSDIPLDYCITPDKIYSFKN